MRQHLYQPRRLLVVSLGAALVFTSLLIASCTSTGNAIGKSPLERLAQRQINRPSERTINAEPPNGLRLAAIDIATEPNAFEPLDIAIERFSREQLPEPWRQPDDAATDDAITPEEQAQALRRYIAGRSELIGGNVAEAIRHLDAATLLDPTAPEIWRTLADAHWLTGDRLAATVSYLRAIQRNPDDAVSLMRVGLSEMDRRSHNSAVILFARAHQSIAAGHAQDAAIPYIVGVALGRTLHELGWMNAGNEAIIGALDELALYSGPTSYRRELSATIRAAGDAWRDAGDASIRLGNPGDAIIAYQRAAEMPTFDPAALLTRQIYANMRLGQPANAAMLLTDRIAHQHGLVDDRTLQLIRYLTSASDIGGALASSIERINQTLTPDERRVAASQLARAQAAALPDDRAIRVLIDRLVLAPSDESAVSDLLNRRSPEDASGLALTVSRLIESNTIETERYANALSRYAPDTESLLDAVSAQVDHTVGANLLGAALSYDLGDSDHAQALLDEALSVRPDDPGVQLAQAMLAIKTGSTTQARALLDTIDTDVNQAAMLAVARAFRRLGDNQRAMTILEERVWGGEATAEEALVAGETSISLGAPLDAEQFFRLAIELDPSLEESYAGLITLYQNNGPLANQASLSDALRALREAIPSSRTLRWLRIQDLLRVERLDQAQRELLSLAEESLDQIVIEQLIGVWLRTGAAETAQTWLTGQLDRRPNNPGLVRLLARVQASQKNTGAAIGTLETWLARHPSDNAASRELENILRLESVDRHDDADVIAISRLNRTIPSVRRSLELAQILIRQKRTPEAIAALNEPLTDELRLNRAGLENYGPMIAGVASFAVKNRNNDPKTAADSITLLQRFLDRFPQANPTAHRTLITLLIQTQASAEEIASVAVAAGVAHPGDSEYFTIGASEQLRSAGESDTAFAVVSEAARAMDSPTPKLMANWMILWINQEVSDPAVVTEILELAEQRTVGLETLLELYQPNDRPAIRGQFEEESALAELAYLAAISCTDSDETARERLYLRVLKHNPRHAMANNNLAYNWVEQGINLDRAHEMLVIAYEEKPGSDAVADSLGWVRYKLGMIDDQRDEQGRIAFPGAVSLLTTAAKLSNNEGAAEILDHLADALWRMGQTDRAIDTWRKANTIVRELLKNPNPNRLQQGLIDTVLPRVERKLDAIADGKVPPLAPMLRPRRWTQEHIDNDTNNESGAPL